MALVPRLLDEWEKVPNDVRGDEELQDLFAVVKEIESAMEDV